MLLLGWLCRNVMEPDAVHYLRLASYYVAGTPGLAVSGHWSPLISCLLAPLLGMGVNPPVACRIFTAASGLLFWSGSLLLLKRLGLPPLAVHLGAWCMTFACASWSVAVITPDLLANGLISFAVACVLSDRWISSRKQECLAGCLWALAYYAKAVALPLGILTCAGLAAWRIVLWGGRRAAVARALACTLAVLMGLAAPWVVLLSVKYHRFTISTAGRHGRVLIGPSQGRPAVPWEKLPEAGRLSYFEAYDEPSVWSPFDSVEHAKHQLKLLLTNGRTIAGHIGKLDLLSIGLIALPFVSILVASDRASLRGERWACGLVPLFSLAAIYETNYCEDRRYFWVALPVLFALAIGLARLVTERGDFPRRSKYLCFVLIGLSFAARPIGNAASLVHGRKQEQGAPCCRELARRLNAKQLGGPVAGGTERTRGYSLWLAYFLDQPWYGGARPASGAELLSSKARIVVVARDEPAARQLASDSHFRDLDPILFGPSGASTQPELKAFEVLH
jgi:hypothetical protein